MKILTCGCCGERAPGSQHWNQDIGFGICPRCVISVLNNPRAGEEELKGYGIPGVHFANPLRNTWQPGMLVAWHTVAADGEFHGWHVGTFKEWDNGTAIVRFEGREKGV